MGKIKWTEKATHNLHSIYEYISRDSVIYAGKFVKSLIKATNRLEDMPYCGRIVPEFENDDFREVIYRNYRIVYRLQGKNNDVEILAVIHGARDMRNLLPEEWEL
jgi:plasmid stabilization system protein ParE